MRRALLLLTILPFSDTQQLPPEAFNIEAEIAPVRPLYEASIPFLQNRNALLQPRHRHAATHVLPPYHSSDSPSILAKRALLSPRDCPYGYGRCDDSGACCQSGTQLCCADGCINRGYGCCNGGGACPETYGCCGNGECAPYANECCTLGGSCPYPTRCVNVDGELGCCRESDCSQSEADTVKGMYQANVFESSSSTGTGATSFSPTSRAATGARAASSSSSYYYTVITWYYTTFFMTPLVYGTNSSPTSVRTSDVSSLSTLAAASSDASSYFASVAATAHPSRVTAPGYDERATSTSDTAGTTATGGAAGLQSRSERAGGREILWGLWAIVLTGVGSGVGMVLL